MRHTLVANVTDHADTLPLDLDMLDLDGAILRPPALNGAEIRKQTPDGIRRSRKHNTCSHFGHYTGPMATPLTKTLQRQINVKGQDYIVTLSPDGLKITLKGKRKGLELSWNALVSGDAALAVALNASVGRFEQR